MIDLSCVTGWILRRHSAEEIPLLVLTVPWSLDSRPCPKIRLPCSSEPPDPPSLKLTAALRASSGSPTWRGEARRLPPKQRKRPCETHRTNIQNRWCVTIEFQCCWGRCTGESHERRVVRGGRQAARWKPPNTGIMITPRRMLFKILPLIISLLQDRYAHQEKSKIGSARQSPYRFKHNR